jgi:hypothetical protein
MSISTNQKGAHDMRSRITKLTAGLTVLGVLAFGGATFASAAAPPVTPPAIEQSSESSSELPPGVAESSSELAPSDGPGGHADDPGNPNVDYQFQGEQ